MKKKMISLVAVLLAALFLWSCATTERTYQGAGAGGALGAAAGALIDRNNRWRGAVIGGVLGAALGGTVTEISSRAAREAAYTGKPVAYQSADGWQRVEAAPVAYNDNKLPQGTRKNLARREARKRRDKRGLRRGETRTGLLGAMS